MGTSNYSDEFKRDAVHRIGVRWYLVREVSQRLGVSTHYLSSIGVGDRAMGTPWSEKPWLGAT